MDKAMREVADMLKEASDKLRDAYGAQSNDVQSLIRQHTSDSTTTTASSGTSSSSATSTTT